MDAKRVVTASLLGSYLDGWADLIEDMGLKENDVNHEFTLQMQGRVIPDVVIEKVSAKPGIFKEEFRDYLLISKSPGLNTLIYIAARGKDLYTSWRSFVNTPINWELLLYFALISFCIYLILLVVQIFKQVSMTYRLIVVNVNSFGEVFHKAILNWFLYSLGIFVLFIIIIAIVSSILQRNWKKDLADYYGFSAILSIVLGYIALTESFPDYLKVFQSLWEPISQLFSGKLKTPWLGFQGVPITFFAIVFGAMFLGFIIKHDILYFITVQPDLFHAEDYTAVNLAVHKSMLRALDKHGIPPEKLRLKQEFKGGRKSEVV